MASNNKHLITSVGSVGSALWVDSVLWASSSAFTVWVPGVAVSQLAVDRDTRRAGLGPLSLPMWFQGLP